MENKYNIPTMKIVDLTSRDVATRYIQDEQEQNELRRKHGIDIDASASIYIVDVNK